MEQKQIQTMGDLMDYASASGTGRSYLRDCFQAFCKNNHANEWDPKTVKSWRGTPVTAKDVASVMIGGIK